MSPPLPLHSHNSYCCHVKLGFIIVLNNEKKLLIKSLQHNANAATNNENNSNKNDKDTYLV